MHQPYTFITGITSSLVGLHFDEAFSYVSFLFIVALISPSRYSRPDHPGHVWSHGVHENPIVFTRIIGAIRHQEGLYRAGIA